MTKDERTYAAEMLVNSRNALTVEFGVNEYWDKRTLKAINMLGFRVKGDEQWALDEEEL